LPKDPANCSYQVQAATDQASVLQVFGLHANADVSYYSSATKELLSNLVDLQPRTGNATGGISRDEFIAGVARDVAAKIPEQFDLPLLHKQLGAPTPTQVVLLQEVERWNSVLAAMSISLKELQRALAGMVCWTCYDGPRIASTI
jgi:dynein heavy chain